MNGTAEPGETVPLMTQLLTSNLETTRLLNLETRRLLGDRPLDADYSVEPVRATANNWWMPWCVIGGVFAVLVTAARVLAH